MAKLYEGCRDPRKRGTSRQGDTTEEVTDTNLIQAKPANERPTLSIPQHLSKSTRYQRTILTTESIQCLQHYSTTLRADSRAGWPLTEEGPSTRWNTEHL